MKRLIGSALTTLGVLVLPTLPVMASTHTVTQGESLWAIARDNQLSVSTLESANPNVNPNRLSIGSEILIPNTYVVQSGDTMWTIAQAHNQTLQAMLSANPNVDSANLQPGQSILIPAQPSSSTSTSTSASSSSTATVDSSSLFWLSRLIEAEASGESLKTKVAIGDVVLHRVQSSAYPNTVQGVIFQISGGHYQFTPVLNKTIYNTPSSSSVQAATEALQQSVDYVPGAYVFFTPSKTPNGSWVWNQPEIAQIGHFIFSK